MDEPRRPAWRQALWLGLLTLIIYLPGLGRQEFVGTEDMRAHIAGQMLDHGNWLQPTFYDRPITTKPPLHYWVTAATFAVTGDRSPWSARLVSLIALAATVAALGAAGRAVGGPVAGWVAGLGYLLAANTLKNGVNAEIDPPFAAFVTGSVLAWWRVADPTRVQARTALGWALAAGVLGGLAALTKGPAAIPFLAGMAGATYVCGARPPWRAVAAAAFPLLMIGLSWPAWLAFAGPDATANAIEQGSEFVTAWNARAFQRTLTYPLALVLASLPLSIAALARLRAAGRDWLDRYLVWTVAVAFLVLMLPALKSTRYLLPCFPLLALAGALRLELLSHTGPFVRGIAVLLAVGCAAALPFVVVALPDAGIVVLGMMILVGLGASRLASSYPVAALLLLALPCRLLFTQVYVPLWETAGNSLQPAVAQLRKVMGPAERLAVVGIQTPRLTDPLAGQVSYFFWPAELDEALAAGKEFDAILYGPYSPGEPAGAPLVRRVRLDQGIYRIYRSTPFP